MQLTVSKLAGGERFIEPSGGDLERGEPQGMDIFLLFMLSFDCDKNDFITSILL